MQQQTLTTRPATYAGLQITAQLAILRESDGRKLHRPEAVAEACADMAQLAQEAFVVITLDRKNNMIAKHLITLGIADASLVHAREVFRPAITDGATACILAHNHPSGDPAPSAQDLKITQQLIDAGKIIDIKILDHVIIGRGTTPFCSLRESCLVSF